MSIRPVGLVKMLTQQCYVSDRPKYLNPSLKQSVGLAAKRVGRAGRHLGRGATGRLGEALEHPDDAFKHLGNSF